MIYGMMVGTAYLERKQLKTANNQSVNVIVNKWIGLNSHDKKGKLFIGTVFNGDVVQIINASTDWSIGIEVLDGEIHEESFSVERGIEMPINVGGKLFFRLAKNGSLKYKIIRSEETGREN